MKLASLEHSLWTQLSCYWGDDLLNWCLATWPVCSELGCRPASLSPFSLFSLLNIIGRLLPPRPICSEGFLITSSRFDVFHGSLCSLGRKTEVPIIIAVAEAELLLFHWTSKGIIRRPRGWLFEAKTWLNYFGLNDVSFPNDLGGYLRQHQFSLDLSFDDQLYHPGRIEFYSEHGSLLLCWRMYESNAICTIHLEASGTSG